MDSGLRVARVKAGAGVGNLLRGPVKDVVGWATIRSEEEQVDRCKIYFGISMNRDGGSGMPQLSV